MNGNGLSGTVHDPDEEGIEAVSLVDGASAMTAVDRASIDMQISTAKQYPRSISKSLAEAMSLATMDEETAASMFYSLPRGGKRIEGPSTRLAEVMAYSWGNLRVDTDIVAEDKTTVTAMGTCFDLEKNVAIRSRVKRRITDSKGKRYNDDMIGVTSMAASSIALRNAVFKVVPRSFVERIYQAARQASIGGAGTLTQKRQAAMEWFAKAGVKAEQLFVVLEVRGLDDIMEDQLITLRGMKSAIKSGEVSVESMFRPTNVSDGAAELNQAIADRKAARANGEGKPAEAAPAPASEPPAAPAPTPAVAAEPLKCDLCFSPGGEHRKDCPNHPDKVAEREDLATLAADAKAPKKGGAK